MRRKIRLKLIVHLVRRETLEREYERIPYEPLTQDILGIAVLKVVIACLMIATFVAFYVLNP